MMCKQVTVTTTPTSLLDLLGSQVGSHRGATVHLQAASDNTNPILYGTKATQVMPLAKGEWAPELCGINLADLYLSVANGTETLNVMVVQ